MSIQHGDLRCIDRKECGVSPCSSIYLDNIIRAYQGIGRKDG
jgi:hypothetical protein